MERERGDAYRALCCSGAAAAAPIYGVSVCLFTRWACFPDLMHMMDCKGVTAVVLGGILHIRVRDARVGPNQNARLALINAKLKEWYDGSVTHSPREMLQIADLEAQECTSCLDDVWQDDFRDRARGVRPPCVMDKGRMRHCARDQLIAYMRRVQQQLQLPVRTHQNVIRAAPTESGRGPT